VEALRAAGYSRRLPALSGLGYRQLLAHLAGETTLAEAVERIKFDTHRFARRQGAWFRESDPRIHWFNLSQGEDSLGAVAALVRGWLGGPGDLAQEGTALD
jgi:tRNA dimethylallyltransferase